MEIFRAFGTLLLDGQEKVERGINQIDKRAKKAESGLQQFGDRVAGVGDKLNKLSGIIGAGGGGLGLLLNAMGGVGREVQNLSRQTGLGVQKTQEFNAVMRDAGLQSQDTADALISLRDRAEDAAAGAQGAKDDFALLGITASELKGKNLDETFNLVADAVKNSSNETQAAVAAQRLFGDEIGRSLIPVLKKGSQGINNLRKEATTLSVEFVESSTKFSKGLGRIGQDFIKLGAILTREIFPIFNNKLIPFWENRLFPALKRGARFIADLVKKFRELPPIVQETAGYLVVIVAALNSLSVIGRLIKLFGRFIPMFTKFNPLLIVLAGAVWLVIKVLKNWDSIVETLGETWQWLKDQFGAIADWIEARVDKLYQNWVQPWVKLVDKTIALMGRLRDQVKAIVGDLFDNTIGKIQQLADQIVGNSIIPDMTASVGEYMRGMADRGIGEADRLAKGVVDAVEGTNPTVQMGVNGPRGRRQGAGGNGGSSVNVDLRNSIIRDGRDMSDRLVRNGVGLTGAF